MCKQYFAFSNPYFYSMSIRHICISHIQRNTLYLTDVCVFRVNNTPCFKPILLQHRHVLLCISNIQRNTLYLTDVCVFHVNVSMLPHILNNTFTTSTCSIMYFTHSKEYFVFHWRMCLLCKRINVPQHSKQYFVFQAHTFTTSTCTIMYFLHSKEYFDTYVSFM